MLNLQHSEKPPPLGMRAPAVGPCSPLLRVFAYAPASSEAHSLLLPCTLPPINPVCLGCIILCASKKENNAAHFLPHAIIYRCPPPSLQSVQFSSIAQSCPALCNPVDCSMPGLLVHHQLLEFHLSLSYLFAFSYCSGGSQGKNTEVICHSLLQ